MTTPSVVACPHCGGQIAADPSLAGQQVACPHCKRALVMPGQTIPAQAVPQPLPVSRPSNATSVLQKPISNKNSQPQWLRTVGGAIAVLIVLCGGVAKVMRTVNRSESRNQTTTQSESGGSSDTSSTDPNKSDDQDKQIGTLQSMGDEFYKGLTFADVAKGSEIDGVPLTQAFCPNSKRKYRRLLADPCYDYPRDPDNVEQARAVGVKPCNDVYETVVDIRYEVTEGEPKYVYKTDEKELLPLIRLGALPGDEWRWKTYDVSSNENLSPLQVC